MKKSLIVSVMLIFAVLASVPCFAMQFYDDELKYGYTLSNNWTCDYGESEEQSYTNESTGETIFVASEYAPKAYSAELLTEESCRKVCDDVLSDSFIAQSYKETNPEASVEVTAASVNTTWEAHNKQKYFKYSKEAVVSAAGYSESKVYYVMYLTVKNERMYMVIYSSNAAPGNPGLGDAEALVGSLNPDSIEIEINGEEIYSDTEPMIVEGRSLVPIRAVAEKMGYAVSWDGQTRSVTMISADGTNTLVFKIGSDEATRNGQPFALDVHAFILGDRTYLPLRAVAEAMDAAVSWNGNETKVEINK